MQLRNNSTLQNGKYRIEKLLGQGGFGVTYLAYQTNLERRVAIKEFFMKEYCVRDESTSHVSVTTEHNRELVSRFRNKFVKEARCIANLSHIHIVRVIDVFEENGTAYYVMDYLVGGTLQDVVQTHGALSMSVALDYIRQVASALDYIHSHNLLHLDVKPSNIMLNDSGEAVLVDFGVSKRYDKSGYQTSNTPLGVSEGYAPIEQYECGGINQFSPSTDIYSLGATFYYLLIGSRPPKASVLLDDSLSFPDNIPDGIQTCIVRAMSPVRKDRLKCIGDFLYLLEISVKEQGYKTKTVGYTNTVNNTYVVESALLKSGRNYCYRKDSFINKIFSKKRLAYVVICLLVSLCVYFFLKSVKVEKPSVSFGEGYINGYEYVDLGLNSGLKWATCNVGASRPEDYGDFYAWGEIQTKSVYTDDNSLTYGKVFGDISSNSQYDVARAKWGDSWRLPTIIEIHELLDQCKWTWVTVGSHNGYRVTGPNGNSIFFPATGCPNGDSVRFRGTSGDYWSGTPCEIDGAYCLSFGDGDAVRDADWCGIHRGEGHPVRPVSE